MFNRLLGRFGANLLRLWNLGGDPDAFADGVQIYSKAGVLYQKDAAGTVAALGSSGGGLTFSDLGTSVSGSVSINLDNGNFFYGTQSGNVTALSLSNVTTEDTFVLQLKQGSGGPYTFAHGLTAKTNGQAIDPGDAVGEYYTLIFTTVDGGTTWTISQEGGAALS